MTEQERAEHLRKSLATVALALVGEGATTDQLARRLRHEAAAVTAEDIGVLLDDLASLGLVRVMSSEPQRYAVTSLGMATLSATLAGDSLADQLEELERLRSDLFTTVSHELRTPLTAIRTCVGLLLDPTAHPDDAERLQLLGTIARNADRMQRLAADVLDLARYRTGNVRLQLRRFNAGDLARSAAALVKPLATARGQTIVVTGTDGQIWVYGDHRRLEQALVNLISNAQKYSPDGSVITVTSEARNATVYWTVTDEGPGISAEDQRHLFERFFVGEPGRSGHRTGVGLGLPTALAIAQAHGGRIDVESQPGHGSRFLLYVPLDGVEDREP